MALSPCADSGFDYLGISAPGEARQGMGDIIPCFPEQQTEARHSGRGSGFPAIRLAGREGGLGREAAARAERQARETMTTHALQNSQANLEMHCS